MSDLLTMLPELEQGKTLYCSVWHTYLTPTGNGEVERTQYLMEGEWAKPRTLHIDQLRDAAILNNQRIAEQHAQHTKDKADFKAASEMVLPFGKHKGKRISEVPQDYVEWLAKQPPRKGGMSEHASNYLHLKEFLDGWPYDEGNHDFDYDWEVENQGS